MERGGCVQPLISSVVNRFIENKWNVTVPLAIPASAKLIKSDPALQVGGLSRLMKKHASEWVAGIPISNRW
jgi:hypothetical protein